ncbi:MAG TPA: zinc-binding alcohol dehydrogenase family protein [Candidatus Sulfotelmatobacter sp.]|nr:zinc-binding alcohol dehydrogenase family protein [Candidatus Sulfotelmatobacter sp.]
MKAVGFYRSLPIDQADALVDVEIDRPVPTGRDLLVKVEAVSVNPVDTKVRMRGNPDPDKPKIMGYDAAGVVAAVGPACSLFKAGDKVWYAGDIARPGTNCEFHLVDERIVGRMPARLSFAEATALPLTTITAWEMLFDRFAIRIGKPAEGGSLLIIGGAGGVGSIAIQLARRLTGLTVIATASRPETLAWCRELGAHHVIDHAKPLREGLRAIGVPAVDYVFSTTQTERHFAEIVEVAAPQGKFGLIDDPKVLDALPFKRKAVSIHWEFMFARPVFETPDMIAQHRLLTEVAGLVDDGLVRTTLTETMGKIDAATLKRAHALIESGRARGKLVLAGF